MHVYSDTAQDTCPQIPISPDIDVSKRCETRLVVENNNRIVVRVDFAGTVCAIGDVGLTNVTVTDDHAGLVFSAPSFANGACANYTGSYFPNVLASPDPALASFSDTVTARGTSTLANRTVEDMATATCELCTPTSH